MKSLKIAIMGTRGIPNHYGGFEQITAYLAPGLVNRGHQVTVYNTHDHPYQQADWKGVEIVHCYNPESQLGTFGQFIYDLNCILDARKRHFDVILFMGYTSSSVWGKLFPKNTAIISNMDGLEWKRSKYSWPVRQFLKYAERLAVKYSHYYIADSAVIKSYLQKKYSIYSAFIAYGAEPYVTDDILIDEFDLKPHEYFLLVARMEPENNIEMILQGFSSGVSSKKFLVVGNTDNKFGRYLRNKFEHDDRICFHDAIFNIGIIQRLQHYAHLYFHGHSVGGTNPSLLEAMAGGALVAAHDNSFNRSVLNRNAFYFSSPEDVQWLTEVVSRHQAEQSMIERNRQRIDKFYNWERIIDQYENYIVACYYSMNYEQILAY
jgi:glycosyltransferase involved in cell wall biosynthesis